MSMISRRAAEGLPKSRNSAGNRSEERVQRWKEEQNGRAAGDVLTHRGGASAANIPPMAGKVDGRKVRSGGNRRGAQNAHQLARGIGVGIGPHVDEVEPGTVKNLVLLVVGAEQGGEFRTARIESPMMRENPIQRVVNGMLGAKVGDDELRFLFRQLHGKREQNECT